MTSEKVLAMEAMEAMVMLQTLVRTSPMMPVMIGRLSRRMSLL